MGTTRLVLVAVLACACGAPAEHDRLDARGPDDDGHASADSRLGDAPGASDAARDAGVDARALDAHPDAHPADAPPDACVPQHVCDPLAMACGAIADDGCGHAVTCGGACPSPDLVCGAQVPNVCGVPAASRTCNADGWCWEYPLPFGMDLAAVWGAAANDIWAAGALGTLLHYDGVAWQPRDAGTAANLTTLWGTTSKNVWIGGDRYLRRWTGNALVTPNGAPDLDVTALRGRAANDVWVLGQFGTTTNLNHWNGSSFTGSNSPDFFAPEDVLPFAANSAWAFGFSDSTIAWDGQSWAHLAGVPATTYAMWGTDPSDVWIAGDNVHHWDGNAWTAAATTGWFYALAGASTHDLWAAGERVLTHFDGQAWTPTAMPGTLAGLWSQSSTDVWGVGLAGRVQQWNGASWTQHSGLGDPRALLTAQTFGDHDAVFVAEDGLYRWHDGAVESIALAAAPSYERLRAGCATSPTDVWAAGYLQPIYHYTPAGWASLPTPTGHPQVTAMWGSSASDVYAVTRAADPFKPSDADVLHWNGSAWSVVKTIAETSWFEGWGVDLHAVSGSGPNDVWVASDQGGVYHWDGVQWTAQPLPNDVWVGALWASPSGAMYATTAYGVYKHAGGAWAAMPGSPAGGAIGGTSDLDVWTTEGTTSPVVHHFDGTWHTSYTSIGEPVIGVAASPRGVFVAGATGGVVRKAR